MSKYMDTRNHSGARMPVPSFWEGAARVLDLGATLNHLGGGETPHEADRKALVSDWSVTGQDLFAAIGRYDRTLGATLQR